MSGQRPPLSDDGLTKWAREHLVYEVRMLAFTAVRLAERQGIPRDPESNGLLESFAVHVRCLRDFLWRDADDPRLHEYDALASDFWDEGAWKAERLPLPPELQQLDENSRAAREVVHLTYHRLGIEAEEKEWPVGSIFGEIRDVMGQFAVGALATRLDDKTREALQDPLWHEPGAGPASVATGAIYGQAITGGTIGWEGFHAGS